MKARAGLRARAEARLIDPISDPQWLELLLDRPSLLFQSPAWMKAIARTYGFPIRAVALYEKGRIQAGLPFALVEDELGPRVVALAFSDFCDPVGPRPAQVSTLLRFLVKLYPQRQIKLRFVSAKAPPPGLGFALKKTARWHGLALEGKEDELFAGLSPRFRRSVLKARKQDLSVRRLKKAELKDFYCLHLKVRKDRYRLLAQPYNFFENVWDAFVKPRQGFFLGAFTPEGRLAAAHCLLFWRETLVYKFGASDYTFTNKGANHLLHWEGARYGLKHGFTLFDLGLSDDDQPGLIEYKRGLGATEKTIAFYERPAPADPPEAQSFRAAIAELTRFATGPEVPDHVTAKLGEALYRYFA